MKNGILVHVISHATKLLDINYNKIFKSDFCSPNFSIFQRLQPASL